MSRRSDSQALRRVALGTVAASVTAFVGLWAVFIETAPGRRLGDRVFSGRAAESVRARLLDDSSLRTITTTTLAVACVALLAVGVIRRRDLLGVTTVAIVMAAAVTAEVLKRAVITRPLTADDAVALAGNSFPSGHATISTALGLAVVMMTPHRWRRVTAIFAALWVSFQATGVVAAGWHRPSDAVAGCAIALAWACVGVWWLAMLGHVVPDAVEDASARVTGRLIVAAVAVALVGLFVAVRSSTDVVPSAQRTAFVVAMVVIDVVAVATVWWFWRMLRAWALDPPEVGAR